LVKGNRGARRADGSHPVSLVNRNVVGSAT